MQVTLFSLFHFCRWLSHYGFLLEMDLMPLLIISVLSTFSDCYWYLIVLFSADSLLFSLNIMHEWINPYIISDIFHSKSLYSISNVYALCMNHVLNIVWMCMLYPYCDGINRRNNGSNDVWEFCFYFMCEVFNACTSYMFPLILRRCYVHLWSFLWLLIQGVLNNWYVIAVINIVHYFFFDLCIQCAQSFHKYSILHHLSLRISSHKLTRRFLQLS